MTSPLDRASPLLAFTLIVRFLLELAMLAGVAALAWRLADGWWRWPAAILAVVAVATLWGLLLSPKAKVNLPASAALALEAALFLGVGAGLIAMGIVVPAVTGVTVWILHRIVLALEAPPG